jgi:Domain of unknown function (DUF4145)
MQTYYPPRYLEKQFHCAYCKVFSAQRWGKFWKGLPGQGFQQHDSLDFCVCEHCQQWSYWHKNQMVVPSEAPVPVAHPDMPTQCKEDYDEAREIVEKSPKAASALLRLSLQKLMVVLGEKGKNINDDIGELVKKGLPVQVQKALDYCRVVGNNAVHPGEIKLDDTPEIANNLFSMMNFIVEDRIARPKQINELYNQLPEGARQAIEKRDGTGTT